MSSLKDDSYILRDAIEKIQKYEGTRIDNVNHPAHYENLLEDYECIDSMVLLFGKEQTISFCRLNAFKYIFRHEKKNGKEDLDKAEWYLHKIEELEEEK